ncbi:MAG: sigma-70 family RNA polymerase sigma factor [Planctomycetota bacterium]|nr:sigma-70 family RNA polymerase sigma factor [Planctomycetota bacterium]
MEADRQSAYAGLLEGCRKPLVSYVRSCLWDKGELDEALQQVLLEGWRKFGSLGPSVTAQDFKRWMFQIATYVAWNTNRASRRAKERNVPLDTAGEFEDSQEQYPGFPLLKGDAATDYRGFLAYGESLLGRMPDNIVAAVDSLPEKERAVFLLRAVGGFSYKEIGLMLEMPIGSVMGRLSRARTALRERLHDDARKLGPAAAMPAGQE